MEEEQLQQRAIGERGDWGCDAAFCRRANGDFREDSDGSRVCEGVGGEKLADSANQGRVRGFACKFRGCLTNFPLPGWSLRNQPPTGNGASQVVPDFAGSAGSAGNTACQQC